MIHFIVFLMYLRFIDQCYWLGSLSYTLVEAFCRCKYNPHDWLSEAFVSAWMSFTVVLYVFSRGDKQ